MTDSASDTYKKITTLSYLLSNSEFGERVREIIDARNREMTEFLEDLIIALVGLGLMLAGHWFA